MESRSEAGLWLWMATTPQMRPARRRAASYSRRRAPSASSGGIGGTKEAIGLASREPLAQDASGMAPKIDRRIEQP